MTFARLLMLASATCVSLAPAIAAAQDFEAQLSARKGQMYTMGISLGVLGGMARGNAEYDAETAQAAADNLVAVTGIDQRFTWPEGTDNAAIDASRALPAIWQDLDGFTQDFADLREAALALQEVAGQGLDAMRPAIGPVGQACQACHEAYREPDS